MTINQYHTKISLDGNTKSDGNQKYNYHKPPPIFNIFCFIICCNWEQAQELSHDLVNLVNTKKKTVL